MSARSWTAVEVLMRYLEAEDVRYIFGIPGGPLMPLYEAMFDHGGIKPIISKHEEGASFMADGYARVRGGLGVCCATTGPGATNALTGVACAMMDCTPVMLITAQVSLEAFGKGAAQESTTHAIDVVDLYKTTKSSLMLLSPERIGETVRHLLRQSLTGRPGPVHLNLPADMVKRPLTAHHAQIKPHSVETYAFDRNAVRAAAEALAGARRPVILAGHGVRLSKAWRSLRQLAERLEIPVATSPKGKGVFPESHPLSMGVFGFAGSPQSKEYFLSDDVDVLLAVGTGLGELATHCWSEQLRPSDTLIQIDVDPTQIGRNYPVQVGIAGDAHTALSEILLEVNYAVRRQGEPDLAARRAAIDRFKASHARYVNVEGFEDTSMPLKPQRLMRELQEVLTDEAILFVDIGNVMAWAIHFLEVNHPGMFQINLGLASMGHAVAAAIGGKLAAPDRPVVALVGDAAFAMNGMEVHTAVENQVPVIWVVMNNGGHGMVMHGERLQFKGKFQTGKFRRPLNIAQLASGMGAQTAIIDRPGQFGQAFADALASREPTVLDVRIDPNAMPPLAMRIETLDRFFAGNEHAANGQPKVPVIEVTHGVNGRVADPQLDRFLGQLGPRS
jgi:acetolactate synthase I/II/III large subunit